MTKFAIALFAAVHVLSHQVHAQTAPTVDPNLQQAVRDAKTTKERAAENKASGDKATNNAKPQSKTSASAVAEKTDAELQAMSRTERKTYMKAQQKKHAEEFKASTGVAIEDLDKLTPAQRKDVLNKLSK